jgi:hypothetical protein
VLRSMQIYSSTSTITYKIRRPAGGLSGASEGRGEVQYLTAGPLGSAAQSIAFNVSM